MNRKINNNNKTIKNTQRTRKRGRSAYRQLASNALTTYVNPRFGFISPRMLTTFKYDEVIDFTLATTVGGQYVFKLNGMFDPNTTGTGHQPYGFDQMLNIYQRYCVLRNRYKIDFGPTSDRLMVGAVAASTVVTTVTNAATFSAAAEVPHSMVKALSFGGGPPAVIRGNIVSNTILGTTPQQMISDDLFQGTTTTDPTNLIVLTVFYYNPSGGSVTTSFNISMEYEAMLFDPYVQNQS